ncbi:hypothetical protein QJS10_CPB19g01777 [Acorus calamus]|uniref:CP-type G domain-containing protein n=1 Tax=Acorus calamus TaxID=4465 RepID=A0AAV9CL40_ACOCL|nr:hypothetical protein QJS10_CPB19g01777 [Acorus calamus]
MGTWSKVGKMGFIAGGGPVNWFPGHMASATTAIRNRLKLADLVIEVRDARIPLSSANEYLQSLISSKRRVIALNKKDLANPNIITQWTQYFDSCKQDCISINAHSTGSVKKLLSFVELKLKERIPKEPTLLVMVVGVPNVGKSALINSIHHIASPRSPVQEKMKRATVGPLPGVTQDIAGYKIAHQPSIYVLDSPGVLVPRIPDIETGLKLALTGSVKDSVVGEERLAKYLLAVLNTRKTPLRWSNLENRQEEKPGSEAMVDKNNIIREPFPRRTAQSNPSDVRSFEDISIDVQRALHTTLSEFEGDLEDENELESLINKQLKALRKAFKIRHRSDDEAFIKVSKKLLTLFRIGRLGTFTLDAVPS